MTETRTKQNSTIIAIFALGLLPTYAVWARNAQGALWLPPLLLLAASVLLLCLFTSGTTIKQNLLRCAKDPLFIPSIVLLGLLVLQWENAGRVQLFDHETGRWKFSTPRRAGWPSAINQKEALEMLQWFAPAVVLLLATRLLNLAQCTKILIGLVFISGANALFGLIFELAKVERMYGIIPLNGHFFATFGYENHAAAYYVLHLCAALGLLLHLLTRHPAERPTGLLPCLSVAAAFLFIGANLTMSLAGILFSWISALFAGAYGCWLFRKKFHPMVWVGLLGAAAVSLILAFFLLQARGSEKMFIEIEQISQHGLEKELSGRREQILPAIDMFKKNPWFGLGGWGYRYHIAEYLEIRKWSWGLKGAANAHNDPAQFLAEFGLVGFGSLSCIVLTIFFEVIRSTFRIRKAGVSWLEHPVMVLSVLGLIITLTHAMIDLPFRCPAVLFSWALIAGVLRVKSADIAEHPYL